MHEHKKSSSIMIFSQTCDLCTSPKLIFNKIKSYIAALVSISQWQNSDIIPQKCKISEFHKRLSKKFRSVMKAPERSTVILKI